LKARPESARVSDGAVNTSPARAGRYRLVPAMQTIPSKPI